MMDAIDSFFSFFKGQRKLFFSVDAEFSVDVIEKINESFALFFHFQSNFCKETAGDHRIFVTGIGSHEIAVRLLSSKEELIASWFLLPLVDFFSDIFKSSEYFKAFDLVSLGDFFEQLGCDDRCDDRAFRRQLLLHLEGFTNEVSGDRSLLITRKGDGFIMVPDDNA